MSVLPSTMTVMYDDVTRRAALDRLAVESVASVSRATGICRSTLRAWRDHLGPASARECPRCDASDLDGAAYSALLGYYLGDGCLSRHRRHHVLRSSCDVAYPIVIADAASVASTSWSD